MRSPKKVKFCCGRIKRNRRTFWGSGYAFPGLWTGKAESAFMLMESGKKRDNTVLYGTKISHAV